MNTQLSVHISHGFKKSHPYFFILLLSFFLLSSYSSQAQGPGSLFVDAGPDVSVPCDSGGNCIDITATFLETFETIESTYTIDPVVYVPPFPFNGLANSLNPNIDDAWSAVDNLPFDFCYFENIETQFQVGSNGVIRFDVDPGDTTNGWSFTENLPNNSNETLGEANVFTPGHDIDPSVSTTEEIAYEVLGEFPNRVLVVAYFEVPMFSATCNALLATQMVVFYEFSNVIEIYIQDKPSCPTWNNGNATLGIQNDAGNIAFVPPGRNTSDSPWTVTEEAWRFTPAGTETYVFEWLDANGTVIGTDPTIEVCPNQVTTYTAQVTYTNCNGEVVVLTDDIVVTPEAEFSVELGEDQISCDISSYEILAALSGNSNGATFLWSTGETTPTITVTQDGNYSVEVTVDVCTLFDSINVDFDDSPIIELGDDIASCLEEVIVLDASPSNYGANEVTYQWSLNGTVIASETSPTLIVSNFGTYSVDVTFEQCTSTDTIVISLGEILVSLGADFETCFEEDVILDASPSNYDPALATYEWSFNEVVIPDETSPTLVVIEGGTYSVIVTIGLCTTEASITISASDDLVVTLGDDFRSCPNETVLITASTDETDVTYQWFEDDNLIEGATDNFIEITIPNTIDISLVYRVIISTGNCTGSAEVTILPYDVENCVISQGISPNGDGFNDALDLEFLSDRAGGINQFLIYNRYGSLVFEAVNYINEWHGQDKDGNELPTGTYFYVIDFMNEDPVYGLQATGWVYINKDAN